MAKYGTCVVCNKRAIPWPDGKACRKCLALTAAEGTREKFGLPKVARNNDHTFVAKLNKLILQGMTRQEVAEEFGVKLQTIKNRIGLLRAAGHKIEESQYFESKRIQPQEPVDRSELSAKANEHGGGKIGIAKCKCEECLAVRTATRKAWERQNQEKVRGYRRRYDKKQPSLRSSDGSSS